MKKVINNFSKKVGHKIKVERTKKDLTQEELAYAANISRSSMGLIERGESSPTIETVKLIADALKIDVYKLFIFD
ncbi:restriction-modification system regulatory protein putative [Fusobacterium sp. CAG:439]|nr:restriction-modification system regulatory protein putative [Fusobacterium sp. CAG:439]HIT93330.1 helix-turn-helix transcriptional regulator [Candidatus Stercorousia faecigallinarum]